MPPAPAGPSPARLVVLVSGTGTLLQALLDTAGHHAVVAVGSDRDGVPALARAARAGVPSFVHPLGPGADRAAWDAELADRIAGHRPDLVVSAGFLKLLGPAVLGRFPGRIVNSHPSLLPSFPGLHGPRDALAYGVKVSGATVFLVDAGVDTGVVLDQVPVRVAEDDTPESLHERIKVAERDLLLSVVHRLATTSWRVVDRKVRWDA